MTDDPSWAALGAGRAAPAAAAASQGAGLAAKSRFARFEPDADATELHQMLLDFGAALARAGHDDPAGAVATLADHLDRAVRNPRAERDLLAALQAIRDHARGLAAIVERYEGRL